MCVTNIYIDRYPDGNEIEYTERSLCINGRPDRPCPSHSHMTHYRKIGTTRLNNPIYPNTPPRSSEGSHRTESPATSEDSGRHRRRHSKDSLKATRQHRKERIIIVDAPPTSRTPPQSFPQHFTPPSSPPSYRRPVSRPIIVDERTIHPQRPRTPSFGAVVGDRTRPIPISIPTTTQIPRRETPAYVRPAFEPRADREHEVFESREERQARRAAEQDAEVRRAQRIADHNRIINSRTAVPVTNSARPSVRPSIRPVVTNAQTLPNMMDRMTLDPRRASRELDPTDTELMQQRLRERQMPKRRFSIGVGERRLSLGYPPDVYRWA
ncbi:hypothetical protein B0O99DRAFT_167432 [Bisporella sp. PMI_857]|nr:hypothetical protein B0O99DRAFT_167432 [Bisporella sp. PMI_857]